MMWRSVGDRLGRLTATMWLIVTVAFFCAYRLPGDPARMILGQRATPEAIENFRHKTGLDQPIAVQYSRFVRRALTLELGESLVQRRPVAGLIRERAGQTLTLILVSLFFLALCGLALPVCLRLIDWQLPQRLYRSLWTLLAIAPPYVLSILALLGFAGWLRWIPVSFDGTRPGAWIVPALVLAAYPIAVIIRLLCDQIENVLASPFVRTARAFGYSEPQVMLRFALPNAITPAMAAFANGVAFFVTGTFFVEVVFGIGGLGTLAYEAVRNKDVSVLVGVSIVFAGSICSISAVLQLVLAALDPRTGAQDA
jgi:peptide/nickel transport system permease protein